jgi:hypothetical protein
LRRALYGHPEGGALWEKMLNRAVGLSGWTPVEGATGVFVHRAPEAYLVTYVDDLLLVARATDAGGL